MLSIMSFKMRLLIITILGLNHMNKKSIGEGKLADYVRSIIGRITGEFSTVKRVNLWKSILNLFINGRINSTLRYKPFPQCC